MILGVGNDLVNINRIKNLIAESKDRFLQKIFTNYEIVCASKINEERRISFYAKRFAAKEAFAKACGLGIGRGVNFCDIEITNDDLGKPFIRLINGKENFLQQHFMVEKFTIHLSLSDDGGLAKAIAIIET